MTIMLSRSKLAALLLLFLCCLSSNSVVGEDKGMNIDGGMTEGGNGGGMAGGGMGMSMNTTDDMGGETDPPLGDDVSPSGAPGLDAPMGGAGGDGEESPSGSPSPAPAPSSKPVTGEEPGAEDGETDIPISPPTFAPGAMPSIPPTSMSDSGTSGGDDANATDADNMDMGGDTNATNGDLGMSSNETGTDGDDVDKGIDTDAGGSENDDEGKAIGVVVGASIGGVVFLAIAVLVGIQVTKRKEDAGGGQNPPSAAGVIIYDGQGEALAPRIIPAQAVLLVSDNPTILQKDTTKVQRPSADALEPSPQHQEIDTPMPEPTAASTPSDGYVVQFKDQIRSTVPERLTQLDP